MLILDDFVELLLLIIIHIIINFFLVSEELLRQVSNLVISQVSGLAFGLIDELDNLIDVEDVILPPFLLFILLFGLLRSLTASFGELCIEEDLLNYR